MRLFNPRRRSPARWLAVKLIWWAWGQNPHQYITDGGNRTLICRYNLFSLPGLLHIRVHHIISSDDARELHNHPWWNITVVLGGGYTELMAERGKQPGEPYRIYPYFRDPGDVVIRGPSATHRLVEPLTRPEYDNAPGGTWTLFIHGPVTRRWGFWNATTGLYRLVPKG